jgi:hypothetical protein
MKKFIASFLLIFILMPCFSIGAIPSETDSGIIYSIENGEVTVEGWGIAGTVMKIPESIEGYPVKYVADQACRGNEGLTEVYLPSSIVSVGEYSFAECKNLVKVVFYGGESIGYSAFRDCKALISLTLPKTLKLIDDSAFENCTMLGKVKIPKSVTSIGVDAFIGCDRVRFDASENPYAKQYAKQYSIPTSFFDTWEFTVLLIALTAAAFIAAYFIIRRVRIKKRNAAQKTA